MHGAARSTRSRSGINGLLSREKGILKNLREKETLRKSVVLEVPVNGLPVLPHITSW